VIRADDGRVLMASANALHFAQKKRAYQSTRASTLLIFNSTETQDPEMTKD
jgi:hypothetical protein